jgi:hypothetical protein
MIFDIRNPLYPLRLMSGRVQTRRAWRLPLNGYCEQFCKSELNFDGPLHCRDGGRDSSPPPTVSFQRLEVLHCVAGGFEEVRPREALRIEYSRLRSRCVQAMGDGVTRAITKQKFVRRPEDLAIMARNLSFPSCARNGQFYVLIRSEKRNVIHDQPNPCLTRHKTPEPLQKNGEAQTGSCEKLQVDPCPSKPGE